MYNKLPRWFEKVEDKERRDPFWGFLRTKSFSSTAQIKLRLFVVNSAYLKPVSFKLTLSFLLLLSKRLTAIIRKRFFKKNLILIKTKFNDDVHNRHIQ